MITIRSRTLLTTGLALATLAVVAPPAAATGGPPPPPAPTTTLPVAPPVATTTPPAPVPTTTLPVTPPVPTTTLPATGSLPPARTRPSSTAGSVGRPVDIGARAPEFQAPHDRSLDEVIAYLGIAGTTYPAGEAELLGGFLEDRGDGTVGAGLLFAVATDLGPDEILAAFRAAYPDADGWYSDVIVEEDGTPVLRVSDFSEFSPGGQIEGRPTGVQIRVRQRGNPGEYNLSIEQFSLDAPTPPLLTTELADAYRVIAAIGAEPERGIYYWGVAEGDTEMEEEWRVVFSKPGTTYTDLADLVRSAAGPISGERQDPDGGGGFAFDAGGLSYYFQPDGTADAVRFG